MDVQTISGVSQSPVRVTTPQSVTPADPTPDVKRQSESAGSSVQSSVGQKDRQVLAEEMMERSIEQANKSLATYNRRIDRAVHEQTKTMIYSIVDTENDEVVQEFPARKIQDMIAKMWELAGLTVDKRA